ncbi:MAG: LytR protein [Patescibacteria group bacterium]|nr:LytR protein [Patescibacteria group bacterium]
MRHNQAETSSPKNSMRTLILFCIIVFCVLFVALSFRILTLMNEARFHGEHIFFVTIESSNQREIAAIDTLGKKVTVISVKPQVASNDLKTFLGVFSEGSIKTSSESYSVDRVLSNLLFKKGNISSNLSLYDEFIIWRLSRGMGEDGIKKVEIVKESSEDEIDRELQEVLVDKVISDENKTIGIINSSGVPGQGRRLERAFENVGGNVISVENGESLQKMSSISYYGEKTKTVERLEKIIGTISTKRERQDLSDIIVTLGTDTKESVLF